jgi:predicted nuclease of predicted toxin-antitoxin system
MKLLFDESIPYRVLTLVQNKFPGSVHFAIAKNIKWDDTFFLHAQVNKLTIVSFEEGFIDLQLLNTFPPKVIWLRFLNTYDTMVAKKLLAHYEQIEEFAENPELGILEIY